MTITCSNCFKIKTDQTPTPENALQSFCKWIYRTFTKTYTSNYQKFALTLHLSTNMTEQQLKSFELLKKKVEITFQKHVTTCQESIQDWKGKQIAKFQEDLSRRVGGYVSEKWFYTHFKATIHEKLPRADMLDMLARYIGYTNWNDFVHQHKEALMLEEASSPKTTKHNSTTRLVFLVVLMGMIGSTVLIVFFRPPSIYRFCLMDEDSGAAIPAHTIEAFWLKKAESPLKLPVDSLACVCMEDTKVDTVELKLQALYYKPLTLKRYLNAAGGTENITLQKDDYALMIHYFSMRKIEDWEKRRRQLGEMLSDNARIVQLDHKTNNGMALYNKQEFINKMTLPSKSLQTIEILETKYEGEQIIEIRFVQTSH